MDNELDDELELALTEWNTIIEDEDLLDLIVENLEMTQPCSVDEASRIASQPSHNDITNAVLEYLENVSFKES